MTESFGIGFPTKYCEYEKFVANFALTRTIRVDIFSETSLHNWLL